MTEEVDDLISYLAGKRFQNARFIQHHATELATGELVQLFIVGDVDTGFHILSLFTKGHIHTEFDTFRHRLRRYGKRGKDQNVAAHTSMYLGGPFKLHRSFA